jgi:hypothetical protein
VNHFVRVLSLVTVLLVFAASSAHAQEATNVGSEEPAACCSNAGIVPQNIVSTKEFKFELSGRDANPGEEFFQYTTVGNTIHYEDLTCSYTFDLSYDFGWKDDAGNPVFYPISYRIVTKHPVTGDLIPYAGTTRTDAFIYARVCSADFILVNEPYSPE